MRMRRYLTVAVMALMAITNPAMADQGHPHDEALVYGEPGDPSKPARIILVAMRETGSGIAFVPNQIKIRAGEQVKFVIRNNGELDHELVFADLASNLKHGMEMAKNPDMEHDDPNAARIEPKKVGEITWKFTNAGKFDFSCLLLGHREAGMFGTIIVQ
ncbi:cupredoxin domain-containing protein [Devosia indica]